MCLFVFQVYKKLGQTHLALANFSWALDLDPKGANNQIKEALDKRYLPDDDEPATVPGNGNTPEDTTGKIQGYWAYAKHLHFSFQLS